MSDDHNESHCPLSGVHQRLQDCHKLWHLTLDSYQDPHEFRVSLQNCIAHLRTVTFILQNHKRIIPDFDVWYAQWQNRMSSDRLMVWARDARNKIEKQGDLSTKSKIYVSIIASYLKNENSTLEMAASVEETVSSIFSRIPRAVLNQHVIKNGALKVQRTWVDEELPEYELLDALSYVYGQLHILTSDAHRQMGIPASDRIAIKHDNKNIIFPASSLELNGRLPCMIASENHRTNLFSLSSGKPIQLAANEPVERPNLKSIPKIVKRYGLNGILSRKKSFSSLEEAAKAHFEVARTMFLKDGHHVSIAILLRNNTPVHLMNTHANDRSEKYVIMERLAQEVERFACNGVLLINEIWRASYDPNRPYIFPQEREDREEALALIAANARGEMMQFESQIIRRRLRKPSLSQTSVSTEGTPYLLAPIQEVWRKQKSDLTSTETTS